MARRYQSGYFAVADGATWRQQRATTATMWRRLPRDYVRHPPSRARAPSPSTTKINFFSATTTTMTKRKENEDTALDNSPSCVLPLFLLSTTHRVH